VDMIERVGRVVCPFQANPCPGKVCRECADKARAAIEAMRTPTHDMLVEGLSTGFFDADAHGKESPLAVWQAMINQALGENVG